MELPVSVIIIIAVAALVLAVVAGFLLTGTSGPMTGADAQKVFYTKCAQYSQSNCDWSVTSGADFGQFLSACRAVFGQDRDKYTCLYTYCASCKDAGSKDIACTSMCKEAEGNKQLGVSTASICKDYAAQCAGQICDAC